MRSICFLFILSCSFISYLMGGEPVSLKQLIAESKKEREPINRATGFSGAFDASDVRKRFYGDEAAFFRSVASLLLTGNRDDVWDAHLLILDLDIDDAAIMQILRDKFESSDRVLRYAFCSILARHPSDENIGFLVDILAQPDYSVETHSYVIYFLAYFSSELSRNYFIYLSDKMKSTVLDTFISLLEDEKKLNDRYAGDGNSLGDYVAFHIGYFGSYAKPALHKIREKFVSEQDVDTKLNLAWAIVRIAPESLESSDALNFLLRKAVEDKSRYTRGNAIGLLETLPEILSDRIVPCLLTVLQREIDISNKVRAAEVLVVMLKHRKHMTIDNGDFYEEREDGEDTE